MSPEEREGKDALESLIARYLEAEKSGHNLDRDGLIEMHPELADSLQEFFANHDRMKAVANRDEPTIPPNGSGLDKATMPPGLRSREDATLPTQPVGDDPTIPPTVGATQPARPSVGDQVRYFGDYELLEEIARGGMGVVFKARQANLNRIVALKMILAGQFAGQEDVRRFYTEAEAAASLDHPGIVPIFEIGEHAGQHYFSMGFIEGESLAHRVINGPLPSREVAELVKKICDAMAYAHERGVIHRDLKPANILIDQTGQPKVTDFGLAKRTQAGSNLTGTGQILGTPAYMPPEQASGKNDDVGPLADVYSLGAVLYCSLTGRPPFQAATPMDTLLQVLDKEPVAPRQLNPTVPLDLETICLKCLNKEPKNRYRAVEDLAAELHRFLAGEPIKARPVSQIERGWRWCRRNRALSVTGAIAATMILAIAIASPIVALTQAELKSQADDRAREATLASIEAAEKRVEAETANYQATKKAIETIEALTDANLLRANALHGLSVPNRKQSALSALSSSRQMKGDAETLASRLADDPDQVRQRHDQFWQDRTRQLRQEAIRWQSLSSIQSFYLTRHPLKDLRSSSFISTTYDVLAVNSHATQLAIIHEPEGKDYSTRSRRVEVVDVVSGDTICSFRIGGTSAYSITVALSDDGRLLLTSDDSLEIHKLPSGVLINSIPLNRYHRLEFNLDHSMLLSVSRPNMNEPSRVVSADGELIQEITRIVALPNEGATGNANSTPAFYPQCFSADNSQVIGMSDDAILFWSLEQRRIVRVLALPPGRRSVAAASANQSNLSFMRTSGERRSLTASPDGKWVLVESVHESSSRNPVWHLFDLDSGEWLSPQTAGASTEISEPGVFLPSGNNAELAVFLSDGRTAAISRRNELLFVSIPDGKIVDRPSLPDTDSTVSKRRNISFSTSTYASQISSLVAATKSDQVFCKVSPGTRPANSESLLETAVVGWDVSRGDFTPNAIPQTLPVRAVAFANDNQVVTGRNDGTIAIADRQGNQRRLIGISDNEGPYLYRVFSPSGSNFLSVLRDGTVSIQDCRSPEPPERISSAQFLGMARSGRFVVRRGRDEQSPTLLQVEDQNEVVLPTEFQNCDLAIFSPDDRYVAAVTQRNVHIFDRSLGKVLYSDAHLINRSIRPTDALSGISKQYVNFDPQSRYVMLSSAASKLRRVLLPGGETTETPCVPPISYGYREMPFLSADGNVAVFLRNPQSDSDRSGTNPANRRTVVAWPLDQAQPVVMDLECDSLSQVIISEDASRMLLKVSRNYNDFFEVCDIQKGQVVSDSVWSSDAEAKLWFFGPYKVGLKTTRAGQTFKTSSFDLSDRILETLDGTPQFSSSNYILADRIVSVVNPPQKDAFFDAKTRRFFTPPPFSDSERSRRILAPEGEGPILLSSDDVSLFFDTSNDVTLSTCEFAIGISAPGTQVILDGTFSDDRSMAALLDKKSHQLVFWDIADGSTIARASLPSHRANRPLITWCRFSPDNLRFVAEIDGQMMLFATSTGEHWASLPRVMHTGPVTDLAVVNDGTEIVSISDDGTVCRWELETGAFVGSFATSGVPLRLSVDDSGKNISVLDRAGHVTSFSTGAGETIELEITDLTEFDPTSDSKQISPIGRVFEPGAIALRGESEPSGLAVWRGSLFRFEARTATFEGPPFVHRKPMQASSEERLLTLVNASNGLIDDSFAYVCNLDFSELTFVNEHLARLGMQPRKCRPFESHEGLRVAAIWRRDNDKAELRLGLSRNALSKAMGASNRVAVDVASYQDDAGAIQFVLISRESSEQEGSHTDVIVVNNDVPSTEFLKLQSKLLALHRFASGNSPPMVAGVVSDESNPHTLGTGLGILNSLETRMEQTSRSGQLPIDVCLVPIQDYFQRFLSQVARNLRTNISSAKTRTVSDTTRIRQTLFLARLTENQRRYEDALKALDPAVKLVLESQSETPPHSVTPSAAKESDSEELKLAEQFLHAEQALRRTITLQNRAIVFLQRAGVLARLERFGEARDDFAKVPEPAELSNPGAQSPSLDFQLERARLLFLLQQPDQAIKICQEISESSDLQLAGIYALGSYKATGPSRQELFNRATSFLDLYASSIDEGTPVSDDRKRKTLIQISSPDFDSLRATESYQRLLRRLQVSTMTCVLWRNLEDTNREKRLIIEESDSHPEIARALAQQGFDPESICAISVDDNGSVIVASIWSREFATPVQTLALASQHEVAAIVDVSGGIRLVNASTLTPIRQLADHAQGARAATFSPDGSLLVVAGEQLKGWNTQSGELVFAMSKQQQNINAIAFSPQGDILAAASEDGQLLLWPIDKLRDSLRKMGLDW